MPTDNALDQSPQSCDQGASTSKPDSLSSNITEEDFVAARNVAYGCLSAIEALGFASGDISTLIYKTRAFEFDDLAILPADEEFSSIIRAVKYLCEVLDSAEVPHIRPSIERRLPDWNDDCVPGKISKVEHWLLGASVGPRQRYSTAHERAYYSAFELWDEIENSVGLEALHEREAYKQGPGFHLEPELIKDAAEEIRYRIRNRNGLKYETDKEAVKEESARALAAWKAEARLESTQRKPPADEDQDDGLLLERVIDILAPQGGGIVKCLWDRKHSMCYDWLAGTPTLWRNGAPSDETIQKALKRVANRLNEHPDLGVTIEISHSKRRVKLTRPPDESGDK